MADEYHPNTVEYDAAVTAKALAEADAHVAEAERRRAEARKLAAEADEREVTAVKAHLDLENKQRDHAEAARSDERNHVYQFTGLVDRGSTAACMKVLRSWHREDERQPITVVFNSPGGSVIDGMALFDELTSLSLHGKGTHRLTTMIRGYAASMAGILLQAGDVRIGGKESYLLIHEISAGTGGKIGEIKDEVKFYERVCARVVDIFVGRSKGKISKATFVKKWKRQDWWLDSAEALKYGFIDSIG